MKNSVAYMKEKLTELVEKFPQLKVRYAFDEMELSHMVEVLPASEFEDNEAYGEYEIALTLDFIKKYPDEELFFVTEGDLIELTDPVFVKKGKAFDGVSVHDILWFSFSQKNLFLQPSFMQKMIWAIKGEFEIRSEIEYSNMSDYEKEMFSALSSPKVTISKVKEIDRKTCQPAEESMLEEVVPDELSILAA